jgi:hypothetical protein
VKDHMYANSLFVRRVSVIVVLLQDTEEHTLAKDLTNVQLKIAQRVLFVKQSLLNI